MFGVVGYLALLWVASCTFGMPEQQTKEPSNKINGCISNIHHMKWIFLEHAEPSQKQCIDDSIPCLVDRI